MAAFARRRYNLIQNRPNDASILPQEVDAEILRRVEAIERGRGCCDVFIVSALRNIPAAHLS